MTSEDRRKVIKEIFTMLEFQAIVLAIERRAMIRLCEAAGVSTEGMMR